MAFAIYRSVLSPSVNPVHWPVIRTNGETRTSCRAGHACSRLQLHRLVWAFGRWNRPMIAFLLIAIAVSGLMLIGFAVLLAMYASWTT